MKKNAQRKKAN